MIQQKIISQVHTQQTNLQYKAKLGWHTPVFESPASYMKLKIKITFRDDKVEEFICVDFPAIGDTWTTLYLEGFKRKTISSATIVFVEQEFIKNENIR